MASKRPRKPVRYGANPRPAVKPARKPKSIVYKIKKAPKFRPGRIV